jgi:multidrug resistance efflux pump
MARKAGGNGTLDQAMRELALAQAQLTHAQATLVNTQTQMAAAQAQANVDRDQMRTEMRELERKIYDELDAIKAILLRHERILEELPEAIRQKIGFKKP